MATPTDSSFGRGFDADKFRSAIKSTMQMGSPNATKDKATFQWVVKRDFAKKDSGNSPFDFAEAPISTEAKPDVQVDVAVEFKPENLVEGTTVGSFDVTRAVITVLDVDYEKVYDADYVMLGDNKYVIEYTAPPVGLFTVDVYSMFVRAIDEV